MNSFLIALLFLTIRIASSIIVQTFFVPDEYWQSLEVAHKLVFGYGHLTWEWTVGIRSYLYPALIAAIYKVLSLLNLDTVELLVIAPRLLQAILSAYADYRFYIWTGRRKWAIFLLVIQYFWFYTASRTLINTLETVLTTVALSHFPWEFEKSSYIWFAALCCFIRPTAGLIWLPLCLYHLKNTRLSKFQLIVKRFFIIGLIVFAFGVGVDSYFYGRLIVTPWEFIKYNLIHRIGSFYGTHPWNWYFTVGLPTILGILTIPFLFAVVQTIRYNKMYPTRAVLLLVIVINLVALSFIEHKEFRFILCLLPMCLYICTESLFRWSRKAPKLLLWTVTIALLVGNAFPTWYLSTIHQRGPIDVMSRLANVAKEYKDENGNKASILFLMPCHSTPYFSHIHQNVTLRFLTCEPNIKNETNYIDEAENFYQSPEKWLRTYLPVYPKSALPTHVVLFAPLANNITDFLKDYHTIHEVPHAEYTTERTGRSILVYERSSGHNEPERIKETKHGSDHGKSKELEDEIIP